MHTRPTQRGTSLLEALVAFLVLSLGLIAIARADAGLRLAATLARDRSEAVRIAQDEIETLRSIDKAETLDALKSSSRAIGAFRIERTIAAGDTPHAKSAAVGVVWIDRSGAAQRVVLHTIVAAGDTTLSGALALR